MENKSAAVIIIGLVAALYIGIMMVGIIDHAYASSKIPRSNDQQNSCGNDALITNIICQNNNSKDHGRNNAWFSKFEAGTDNSEQINHSFLIRVKRLLLIL